MKTSARRLPLDAERTVLRQSNCWQDPLVLVEALQPAPGKRVITAAGAGDNAFALAAEGPSVIAFDPNPCQIACVELKAAAIRILEYNDLLRFVGVRPSSDRTLRYRELRRCLSAASRQYWDEHREWVEAGLVHAGSFERDMNRFRSRALPWIHWRHTVETLFVPKDEEERFSFHDKEWNGLRWRLALRSLVGPAVIRHFLGDSLGDRASRDLAVHRMAVRARHAVTTLAAHANPFIEFMLTGGFNRNLPAYLAPTRYVSLLDGLTRLTLTECPAADAIERFGASGYDGVNLAALLDGTQDSDLQHILGSIRDAARPDARIASWSLLPNRRRFGSLGDRLRPRDDLAAALFARDRVFFYSDFAVAELTASSV